MQQRNVYSSPLPPQRITSFANSAPAVLLADKLHSQIGHRFEQPSKVATCLLLEALVDFSPRFQNEHPRIHVRNRLPSARHSRRCRSARTHSW